MSSAGREQGIRMKSALNSYRPHVVLINLHMLPNDSDIIARARA